MKTSCPLKIFFLLVFYVFHGLASAQVNLSQGLIAHYPFDGNANDASGNGNNGITQNNIQLTNDRFGNVNSAYSFDGVDDYITVPNSSSLNPLTGLSVALYFKASQTTVQTLVGKISYSGGIGTQFQVGMGFPLYPGVFFGVNPPNTGCSGQITVNSSYVNNGAIALNEWHCLVGSFENGTQKLYVDGILIQTKTTGFTTLNQCSNSDIRIGSWWAGDPQLFKGIIDDIRIYNRALTEDEINSLCGTTQSVVPSFTMPDTVCINDPVTITNTTIGASSYYWNFCVADVNTAPVGTNLGNIGGTFSGPVFFDYAFDGTNWYGFQTNNWSGNLIRLDFGSSLLNTPVATNLGSVGGIVPKETEGIQMVKNEGKWYAIIVGGDPTTFGSKIVKIEFGSDLANNAPTGTNWGNIGNLNYPHDLYLFEDNGNWYGFTVNARNNTITRFNFTSSFSNAPTALNLGNLVNLNYPTGICAIKENNNWYAFVASADNSSLTRLSFGSSLLNTPTAQNMGNINGMFSKSWDIQILKYCEQNIGFVINAATGELLRLDFGNSIVNTPTVSSYGNIGDLSFPHCLSRLFRVGPDLYTFVSNVNNSSLTRIKFTGCTNASIPSSTAQNPPSIVYNIPGTYNVNLTIDDGLPTQGSICKQVVVLAAPIHTPTQNLSICSGGTIKVGSPVKFAKYQWSTGEVSDSIIINSAGTYWVESNRYGCSIRDSFIVTINSIESAQVFNSDTTIFAGDVVQLNSYSPSGLYNWSPSSNLNCTNCSHPIASPLNTTTYVLTGSASCGVSKDSVRITVVNRTTAQCYNLQSSIGTSFFDRAYDVASSLNDEFFVAGVTRVNGNDDILISKMNLDGTIIWSKTFGGPGMESVRKITSTTDAGVLVTGQSKSFGNNNGDILCFKVNSLGTLVWSKKFGVGSPNGDLGMDVIETTDGGYALSGILNVAGGVADGIVIKLDNNANILWSKRFNSGTGEDGVGIVQKGDTLIVASDIETASGNYNFIMTKLKLADGSVLASKKLTPASRGLFNPYIYKNPAAPGYIISGHTIDLVSYNNMQHTVITVDDNLNVVNTKLISVNPVTNDFFTGFVPLADGSFLGTSSPQSNADGYVYRIANNGAVMYAKKFNGAADRRLYRLTTTGQEAIAVGGSILNGQEDFFVTKFKSDGSLGFNCEVENVSIAVQQPLFGASQFTWATVTSASFGNTDITLNNPTISLTENDVCSRPEFDFGFQQDMCSPKSVQFTSKMSGVQAYAWNFGNGQTNNNSLTPLVTYADYGTYAIKLNVQYTTGCADSLTKTITIENVFDNTIVINNDTTICLGDSNLLKTINSISGYCWKTSVGTAPTLLNTYVKPSIPTTYVLTSQIVGSNLVTNPGFSSGNTGFTSTYNYSNTNTTESQYWVGTSPVSWNPSFSNCTGHSGNGNMLMVNGSPTPNVKVWTQTVAVTPNTNYNFSIWISSLHAANPAKLQFSINNAELGNNISADNSTCLWKQFSSTWNSGNNTSAIISIVSNNSTASGNDFALDDIFFGEVQTKTDSLNVNVVGLCDSVKITGVDKICSATDTVTYSIYKSPNCTQLYSMQVDSEFATIVSQTPAAIKLLFRKNGTTNIKVAYANNCKIVVDSLDVNIKFSPTSINLGPDMVTCRDTSLSVNAGDGFISYAWQDGSTNSTFTITTPGNYNVVAQNFCGAQLRDTFRLIKSFVTPFTVSPLNANVCKGDSVQFKANGGTDYAWSPATNFNRPTASSTKGLINASQDFTVYISDSVCRRDTTMVIPVTASPGANISVTKSNDVNCGNDSAILVANGGISYTWSPNLFISRNAGNKITVKPHQNTTYVVRGKDELGCFGQDSVTVFFFNEGDQKLFIPTAFTPNGDGKNEIFSPTFIGPSAKYDFKIYNRWGQLVYESKVPGTGWDGRVNGIPQKADVYVFYITAEGGCNGKFVQKGTFALIR